MKGSPADPNRLYASQCSGWFGQLVQRSNDGGKTWEPVGNKFVYEGVTGTHQWYDGTSHPWDFKRVWHLEPSLTNPDTVYAGVEDAALFRSTDAGLTWQELPGLRGHSTGSRWQPGAGGMGLHTILLDPADPGRIFIAISAAGAFRSDDGGETWLAINQGLRSEYIPDPNAEVGHCVHRIAMHPSRPNVLFMQKHWDVMRTDNAGESWREVSGNLPTDFGFVVDVHRARAGDRLRGSDQERLGALPARGKAARVPQPDGRKRVGSAHEGAAAERLLRERAAGRDGRRFTRPLRRLLRHHRRTGVRLGRRRRHVGSDCSRPSRRVVRRSADAAMIRVVLPGHLRTLARVGGEVDYSTSRVR